MKRFKFPTAFTVLAAVLLLVWIASFFVPAGAYKTDPSTGAPVPGTYHKLPSCDAPAVPGRVRRNWFPKRTPAAAFPATHRRARAV